MFEKLEKRKQDFDDAYDLLIGENATAELDSAKNAFDDALEAYFDNVTLDEDEGEDENAKKDSTDKKKGE